MKAWQVTRELRRVARREVSASEPDLWPAIRQRIAPSGDFAHQSPRRRGRSSGGDPSSIYVWRSNGRSPGLPAGRRMLAAVLVLVLATGALTMLFSTRGGGSLPAGTTGTPSLAASASPVTPLAWTSNGQLTVPATEKRGSTVTAEIHAQIMPTRDLRLSVAVTAARNQLVWHIVTAPCSVIMGQPEPKDAAQDVVPPFIQRPGSSTLVPADRTHQSLSVAAYRLWNRSPVACATVPSVPATLALTFPAAAEVPATCPVTRPQSPPFVPTATYPSTPAYGTQFWYGTGNLWTALPLSGTWDMLPNVGGVYSQKVFWWSPDYPSELAKDSAHYAFPPFTVTGRRLDGPAGKLEVDRATNATDSNGTSILVGVGLPGPGCWKLTGHYEGHDLSFVIWVGSGTRSSSGNFPAARLSNDERPLS